MATYTITLLLFGLVLVNGHTKNDRTLDKLSNELKKIEAKQTDIYDALDTLETNLNAMFAGIGGDNDDNRVTVDETARKSGGQIAQYAKRLKNLEQNIQSIKNYITGEKQLDAYLRELSTHKLNDIDEQLAKAEEFSDASKAVVRESLASVGVTLNSVRDIADKRNFHLGGAIFYGEHGSSCNEGNDECQAPMMECRAGQCRCISGFSYDRASRSCVEYCDVYGDDFEVVPNYILRGNNSEVHEHASLEDCKGLCRNATDFQCLTFDYFNRFEACYLSEVTKLEENDQWEYNGVGSHFQRNCG